MKKPVIILISLTAAFILLLTGFFIGRIVTDGSVSIYTQKSFRNESIKKTGIKTPIVNINTANLDQLQDLPGIGPHTAESIIEYREENGPFKYKVEIMDVPGIGKSTYDEIKSLICVNDTD